MSEKNSSEKSAKSSSSTPGNAPSPFDDLDSEILRSSTDDIINRTRLIENEIRVLKSEQSRLQHERMAMMEKIKDNQQKINMNRQLPYLVGNVVEILDLSPENSEEDGATVDLDSQRRGKCAVIKTSTRQTIFLPLVGLVEPEELTAGDLVG
ncbi:26S proteasome regulatory subunit 6A, partial [Dispira parvispora]